MCKKTWGKGFYISKSKGRDQYPVTRAATSSIRKDMPSSREGKDGKDSTDQ